MHRFLLCQPRATACLFIALSIAIGLIVLMGWAFSIPAMTRISPAWIAMQPMTAVTLITSTIALAAFTQRKRLIAACLGIAIAALSSVVLLQHWTGWLPQLDTLLFPEKVLNQPGHLYPGRSAEIVAIEFLIFSVFLAWPRHSPKHYRRASLLANLGLIIAISAIAGYFVGARELFQAGGYVSMSAPTSIGFVCLFAAALAAQKDGNWIHVITSPHTNRSITRKLLLIVAAWPLVLAMLISLIDHHFSSIQLELAIYALTLSIGLAIAIIQFSKRIMRTEVQRNQVMQALERSRAQLASILESTHEGIITIDRNRRIVFCNPAAAKMFGASSEHVLNEPIETFLPSFHPHANGTSSSYLVEQLYTEHAFAVIDVMQGARKEGLLFPVEVSLSQTDTQEARLCTLILRDLSERKQYEDQLRDHQYRLSLAMQAGRTGVWEMEVQTERILSASDLLCKTLGYETNELITLRDWMAFFHEEDRPVMRAALERVINGAQETCRLEMRMLAKDGSFRWLLCQANAADRDRYGKALRLLGTYTDITERKVAEDKAREASLHDALTGLPNRAFIFEFGGHLLSASSRTHQHCALLSINLDRFKPINDVHGHHIGDQILQQVAQRLLQASRAEDMVGRLGGDEFVVVLPHLDHSRQRAASVAQHILDAITAPFTVGALSVSLSPSIGISYYPNDASNMSELIHAADLAMHLAKQCGRANYQFYDPQLESHAEEVYAVEACIRNALSKGGFSLHYQPVVDIETGALISAEALVRLTDERGNTVPPQRFIPIAEATGLISEVGQWVTSEACRQIRTWRCEYGLDVTVAINVSPRQFRQAGFAEKFIRTIIASGINPQQTQMEVTESAVMESVEEAVEILHSIKAQGIKVALDDFGTGYSSLSVLSTLPLDKLKVDQSFVHKLITDASSRAVTDTIIALGRSLNLEVIGEGIETKEMLSYLQSIGCHQAQGYLVSKPLSAPDFIQWCQQHQMLTTPPQVQTEMALDVVQSEPAKGPADHSSSA